MPRNRASKAELTKRRQEIRELLVQGHKKSFIIERMSEQHKTSKRAIQEDIRLIGQEWSEKAKENIQQTKNLYEERLEWLFCEAAGKGHIKVALEVQKELSKLNGLYKDKEDTKDEGPKIINIGKKADLKVVDGE